MIEQIKSQIPIESLIATRFTIIGSGQTLTTEEHDSLQIFTDTNSYYWYSKARGGSVIDWMINEEGKTSKAAIDALTEMLGAPLISKPAPKEKVVKVSPNRNEWESRATKKLKDAQSCLWDQRGESARAYLEGRGLTPETCKLFGLGYAPEVSLPGTWNKKTRAFSHSQQPAIVIPWLSGSNKKLVAIRYRFFEKHVYADVKGNQRKAKQTALYDSDFSKRLYGGHCLRNLNGGEILIICEGEINAMSLWQTCKHADVLSMGSEGQRFADRFNEFAQQWPKIITWLDNPELAKQVALSISGAHAISSPGGKDANDLMMDGILEDYMNAIFNKMDGSSGFALVDFEDGFNVYEGIQVGEITL